MTSELGIIIPVCDSSWLLYTVQDSCEETMSIISLGIIWSPTNLELEQPLQALQSGL